MTKTIDEIAEIAGVSKTTVSLVINGRGEKYRISKKTQKRIPLHPILGGIALIGRVALLVASARRRVEPYSSLVS